MIKTERQRQMHKEKDRSTEIGGQRRKEETKYKQQKGRQMERKKVRKKIKKGRRQNVRKTEIQK